MRLAFAAAGCIFIGISWGQGQNQPQPNPPLKDPRMIASGQKLFGAACSGCHGKTGEGGRGPKLSEGGLIRRASDERLFSSIKNGIPGSDMPGFSLPEDQVWQIVAYLRSFSAPAIENSPPGDIPAGRILFHGKAGCTQCHMIRGHGGVLGPDLSNAGAARTVKQLRDSVLDPNARIAEGFRPAVVVTNSGVTLRGVAKNFDNYSLQLMDASGKLHLFDASELKSVKLEDTSPMPADYRQRLEAAEIDNLIAFLSAQAIRTGRTPAQDRK